MINACVKANQHKRAQRLSTTKTQTLGITITRLIGQQEQSESTLSGNTYRLTGWPKQQNVININ